jgi:hypothetical protein
LLRWIATLVTLWVNNGRGGRSSGTSAVPQTADDFGAPRKSAEMGHIRTFAIAKVLPNLSVALAAAVC